MNISLSVFATLLALVAYPLLAEELVNDNQTSKIFISVDAPEHQNAPAWEVAKEIGMRLPVGGTLTTKAYQQIYSNHYQQSILLGLNWGERPGPYVIKSKSLPHAELQITEIFPSQNVDDLVVAFLEAKQKFSKHNGNKPRLNMLILHAGIEEGCEMVKEKLDCPFEGQFHQFMRRLPPTQIDIIVRPGAGSLISNIKNTLYLEIPKSGEIAYDLSIDSELKANAEAITLCKYVSQHSQACRGSQTASVNIAPAMYLGRSVQRQINTLLSSQTSLSPGLQKPDAESL